MKILKSLLIPACAIIIWGLHILALYIPDCFGFDQFRYFSGAFIFGWTTIFLVLILIFSFAPLPGLFEKLGSHLILIILCACWLAGLIYLQTAAPLLGDGFERINALPSGLLKSLRNQPVPLDIYLHWLAFKFQDWFFGRPEGHQFAYTLASYIAGALFFLLAIIFSAEVFSSKMSRLVFMVSLSLAGFVQLFAGYAENYCFLPAAIMFWMIAAKEAEQGKFALLALAQILLVLLHFFFLFLLPVTLWLVWRGSGKKSWAIITLLILTGIGVAIMAFVMVREHYRGPAILISFFQFFTFSHLIDYLNYQMLSAPALLILLAALIVVPKDAKLSLHEQSYLLASLIFSAFFFILRPVLGAVRDWDLFAIPAMVYLPFLLAYLLPRLEKDLKALSVFSACVILISAFHTVPWLMLNHAENKMTARMFRHLDERQDRERWASAYGYLISAKYFSSIVKNSDADSAFQKSISINPDYSVTHQEYGLFLFRLGNYDRGIKELEAAHRINPTNPGIKTMLANFYLLHAKKQISDKNLEAAEAGLEKMFKLAPDWQDGLRALAEFYEFNKPDPEKAKYYRSLIGAQKP